MQAIITFPEKKEDIQALEAVLKALKIKFEYRDRKTEIESKSFSEKIKKAEENYKNGEYITIKDTKNIWESILSE
jgi:uncharacterized protein YajQ (UPF0234 family)